MRVAWIRALSLAGMAAIWTCSNPASRAETHAQGENLLVTHNPIGQYGGDLVMALRSEPKTLNPVTAVDESSKEVISCLNADLIHINRQSPKTEPALAQSWSVSRDGRVYTLRLRRGVRFSDGQPFDADDVVFSFQVYLDEKMHSPQHDLLIVGGKPVEVRKVDSYTVRFELAQPYAAAERLFDSFYILPKHKLEKVYREGRLAEEWGVETSPDSFAGLGPFRLKEYVPGQRVVLERNPYYWKSDRQGQRLPYLNELTFLFVPTEDAQILRFIAGDTDVLSRFSAENYSALERSAKGKGYRLFDLGPGLEYNFLFFNLNDVGPKASQEIVRKQSWFRDVRFRQAVSAAIDREGIVRLIYNGRATALWGNVTPGNKLWLDTRIPHPPRSLERARQLLASAGFSWKKNGALQDTGGNPVEFSILVSSSSSERMKMATIIQNDLSQLGMSVHVVALEFHAVVDRLLNSYDYEACIMGLASGDADPNAEMNVWLSSGGTHLWHLGESRPTTRWEAEIDRLMQQQLVTRNYEERRDRYDKVQELIAENLPVICLVSPDILAAAKDRVGNFQPAILVPYALWNVEELYLRPAGGDLRQ